MGEGDESEVVTLQQRLRSNLTQLYAEQAILERIVYKNKNQHRRSLYFQYLLKVRRDLKLFQTARLEDLMSTCFQVIIGDKPKQRIFHLESLKKGACGGGKPTFMESLLGAARLLAEMVEPMIKAACEISILLARSFFMAFSLTVVALLARLRVLVQQILLDSVSVFNMVCSISRERQYAKLTHEGVEVTREYYPHKRDYLTLECVWATDKYMLLEKTLRIDDDQLKAPGVYVPSVTSDVRYNSVRFLLEDEPVLATDSLEPQNFDERSLYQPDIPSGLHSSVPGNGMVATQSSSRCEFPNGVSPTLMSATVDIPMAKNSNKVAFVSVKRPSLPSPSDSKPEAKRTRPELPAGRDDPFFNMLTGGLIQDKKL